jgi:cytochrome c-type biogenesis protein CcmH
MPGPMPVKLLILCVVLGWMQAAQATVIDASLPDAGQEMQARSLFHELRCVVCDGQSLADSDATLAVEMRRAIRGMVAEGKTDAQILTFFRDRYGEKVLMTPPFERNTMVLWAMPLLFLLAGGFFIWRATTHRAKNPS